MRGAREIKIHRVKAALSFLDDHVLVSVFTHLKWSVMPLSFHAGLSGRSNEKAFDIPGFFI